MERFKSLDDKKPRLEFGQVTSRLRTQILMGFMNGRMSGDETSCILISSDYEAINYRLLQDSFKYLPTSN